MSHFSASVPEGWRLPKRLAYIADRSLPISSDDYAVRTHEIARSMAASGFDVVVFTRPGRPWDGEGFSPSANVPLDMTLDDVRYIFLPTFDQHGLSLRNGLRSAERALHEAMQVFRPVAIMAASTWENARPAANVARRLGLPFFYEFRGDGELGCEPGQDEGSARALLKKEETELAGAADAVIAPTGPLQDKLASRGVLPDRILLVPNGVRSKPPRAPILRRSQLHCSAKRLVGYFGSLSADEKVDDVVRLVSRMRDEGTDIAGLIAGFGVPHSATGNSTDDQAIATLQKLAQEMGIEDYIHFAPQVSWNNVGGYFALCDAVIVPRPDSLPVDRIAPLKPYEAAAYGVPVVVSDSPSLDELAEDIHASRFASGDLAGLAEQLRDCFDNGHPMLLNSLPKDSFWRARIRPLASQMEAISGKEIARQSARASILGADPKFNVPPFDLTTIPEAFLAPERILPIAGIGPCDKQRGEASSFTELTRSNLHSHLALAPPGIFMVDWAGLRSNRTDDEHDEWADLWTIFDMRVNRQMMDACRIAVNRGWRLVALGPIHGSQAPLFRTVSGLFEVVTSVGEEPTL